MFNTVVEICGKFLWGPPMLTVFIGTGLLFTLRSGFFQITHIRQWLGGTLIAAFRDKDARRSSGQSISQLQAMSAALAACMGTGNIVGVATAIRAGGPGALFWMCFSAVLGSMTACAENILGIRYRQKNEKGEWSGGAMMYISGGLGMKKTAWAYALLLTLASFGIGNMTQVNSAADALSGAFAVPPYITGMAACFLTGLVIFGGITRIAAVAEKVVPVISVVFIVSAVVVLAINRQRIPEAAAMILRGAFTLKSAAGGAAGYGMGRAMRFGIARGVFSNEAGLGSSAIIHAAADTDSPAAQGMWGILEVFLDTVVMCTVTGFVILTSGAYSGGTALDGAGLFGAAFSGALGKVGDVLLAVTLTLLAFASVTGWAYYGERGAEYMLGRRAVPAYRVIFTALVFVGSVTKLDTVWAVSDIFNGLMAAPNLLAVLLLSGEVMRELKKFKKESRPL
ncbi:MAG: sodium:alanine symporter family protein [Oscillospiraceae bacterium]|nr:sodium:alanine symporter family protein [Oscillospiraceae bacterium]